MALCTWMAYVDSHGDYVNGIPGDDITSPTQYVRN